ncbi:MAG: hypothetical protein ACOYT8_00835 [Candidatus Dependentiae bacterium]
MRIKYLILVLLCTFSASAFVVSPVSWCISAQTVCKQLRKKVVTCDFFDTKTKQLLCKSIKRFKYIPGFTKTLENTITRTSVIKGSLYEIQCAYTLAKQNPIKGFNQIKKGSGIHAQFDLIAFEGNKECWIECKSIDWQKAWDNKKRRKGLQEQFLRQQTIVREHNQPIAQHKTIYCVHSATPITITWQEWFEKNNILFKESFIMY